MPSATVQLARARTRSLRLVTRRARNQIHRMRPKAAQRAAARLLEPCRFRDTHDRCETCHATGQPLYWEPGPYEYPDDGAYLCAYCTILRYGRQVFDEWCVWWVSGRRHPFMPPRGQRPRPGDSREV